MLLTCGPAGTAHHTDSCVVVFIEIAADLEDPTLQAESLSFDGRLPHIQFLIRAAARDDGCAEAKDILAPSIPGSADEGQARVSFLVVRARSAKRAAKSAAPSGVAALLPKCQSVQFWSCLAGNVSCFAKVGEPCTSRGSRSAWTAQASVAAARQANLRFSVRKGDANQFSASRACPNPCEAGFSVGQAQRCTLAGEGVQCGRRVVTAEAA